VPKSHQWFDFGGTVYPTTDEADLKAGRMAAFNKLGQRLIEAAHDKDPFVQERAKRNLNVWIPEANMTENEAGRVSNKALQSQFNANSTVTALANDALKSADAKEQAGETTVDNRERLNDFYQKQANVHGGELSIGYNTYTNATVPTSGTLVAQNPTDFNGNWITRNNLNNAGTVAQQAAQPNRPAVEGNLEPSPYDLKDDARYVPPATQGSLTRQGAGSLVL